MEIRTATTGLLDRVAVIALGTAVVVGCLRQGGFYAGDATLVLALVVVAVAARFAAGAAHRAGAAIAVLLGFAGWTVLTAALHGSADDGIAAAAVTCGVAAALWVAAGASGASWELLRVVVLAAGVVVALTGWVGVALHVDPLALVSSGLWRASSTLTYANATAAFLTITVLFAVATHGDNGPARCAPGGRAAAISPRDAPSTERFCVAVMLVGLVATMSRAGLLALGVGLAICACSASQRARMVPLWPALPAAAVAVAALLPALPADSPPQPVIALAGLLAGAAVLLLAQRRVGVVAVVLGVAAVLVVAPVGGALHGIADTRLTASSAERDDLRRVTEEQFATSPLVGVGPGNLDLVYVDHTGALVSAEYTHDEFLQTAAETGVIGLALVLAAFATAARRSPGSLAVVAAFGVHSAFDFLWHIPVLPLLAAVAVGLLVSVPTPMGNP